MSQRSPGLLVLHRSLPWPENSKVTSCTSIALQMVTPRNPTRETQVSALLQKELVANMGQVQFVLKQPVVSGGVALGHQ